MASDSPLPPGARVVAYYRDSGHADQERSVGQQRRAAEVYCEQYHLVLLRAFADEARPGGSVVGREAFQEMIDYLRRLAPEPERGTRDPEAPDGLLYWDIKRFARDQDDSAYFRADLRRRGYEVISLSDSIPHGDLAQVFEAMLSWKAEQDRRDLSKDICRGLHDLVTTRGPDGRYANVCPGGVAVGFRAEPYELGAKRDGTPRVVQRLVPDKESGVWARVRRAWEMRARGATYYEIDDATHLYRTMGGYIKLFRNTIYRGALAYGDEVYEGWIEPCISQEIWDQVQGRRRPAGQHKPRLGTSSYTLSGWLECGVCGSAMTGSRSTSRKKTKVFRYRYYLCSLAKSSRRTRCSMTSMFRSEYLEDAVYHVLTEAVLRPRVLVAMLEDAEPDDEERRALQHEVERLGAELARLTTSFKRLIDAVEHGGELQGLVDRLQARQAEKERIESELSTCRRWEMRRWVIWLLLLCLLIRCGDEAVPTLEVMATPDLVATSTRAVVTAIATKTPTPTTLPSPRAPEPTTPQATDTPLPTQAQPTETPAPSTTQPPDAERTEAQVVRVVDGDTIEVSIDGDIFPLRYIGMDCPEPGTPQGDRATEVNRELVGGQTVYLEVDVSDTDPYDRLLRYVYLADGTFVNARLVRQGFAVAKEYPPDTRLSQRLANAQVKAEEAQVGFWAPAATLVLPTSEPVAATPTGQAPQPTQPPPPTEAPAVCSCGGNLYNCGDFGTHSRAQACYEYCRAQGFGDVHQLDGDDDGSACETLP